jgi:hypothetical protein
VNNAPGKMKATRTMNRRFTVLASEMSNLGFPSSNHTVELHFTCVQLVKWFKHRTKLYLLVVLYFLSFCESNLAFGDITWATVNNKYTSHIAGLELKVSEYAEKHDNHDL